MAKRARLKKSDKLHVQIIVTVWIVFSMFFCFIPLYLTVINSLKTHYEIQQSIFALPSFRFSVIAENYSAASGRVFRSMWNSIWTSVVTAFFHTLLGSIMAYIFTRKDFPGKEFFYRFYIIILLVPSVLGLTSLLELTTSLGLADSYFGLWVPTVLAGQAGAVFLFRTFFVQQPKEIFESAKVDGANDFSIFIHMIIPMSYPIMLYNALGVFSGQYNDYTWSSLVISSADKRLLMPIIQSLVSGLESERMRGAEYALYIICSIPLIITTAISIKFFQSGEFAAGLKL